MDEIQTVLAILRMPHLRYQPGESSAEVLDRMREMLRRAENPSAPFNPERFRFPTS
jgi:hypothetical protein